MLSNKEVKSNRLCGRGLAISVILLITMVLLVSSDWKPVQSAKNPKLANQIESVDKETSCPTVQGPLKSSTLTGGTSFGPTSPPSGKYLTGLHVSGNSLEIKGLFGWFDYKDPLTTTADFSYGTVSTFSNYYGCPSGQHIDRIDFKVTQSSAFLIYLVPHCTGGGASAALTPEQALMGKELMGSSSTVHFSVSFCAAMTGVSGEISSSKMINLKFYSMAPAPAPAPLTISPTSYSGLSPKITVNGGRLGANGHPTFALIKSAIEQYGCDKLNVFFWAVHHWSFSTPKASDCQVSSNSISILTPGSPHGSWRGAWALDITIKSDNTISSCKYRSSMWYTWTKGCHLYGHGSGWFGILFSVQQPSWFTQAVSVPQVNTDLMHLGILSGDCQHFEITQTDGTKVQFVDSSCWYSNADWVQVYGVNQAKNLVVGISVAAHNTWGVQMNLVGCQIYNLVGGVTSAQHVSTGAQFPSSFGLNAKCDIASVKYLV